VSRSEGKALRLEDSLNETCPWSGEPVSADGLTTYRGRVVGFCNPGCRDKFEAAISLFDTVVEASDPALTPGGAMR
jgi:hypothetical protein